MNRRASCALLSLLAVLSRQCCAMGDIKRVSPSSSDDVASLINKTSQVLDEVTALPLFNMDSVGGVITIAASGNYQLAEDLVYPVVIAASRVRLNLCAHKISCSINGQSALSISSASALQQILICNGYLECSAATPGYGVYIPANTSNVTLERLTITGFTAGVWCAGTDSSNTVTRCDFSYLSLVANAKGMLLDWADANIIQNSSALYASVSGFELNNAQANCFYDCNALQSTGTATIVGFKSTGGTSNLFQRCCAQQTKINSDTFGGTACGFLLTGTEQGTMISDCMVSDTDVLSSSTVAVTYGIHCAPTILEGTDLLSSITLWQNLGQTVRGMHWSPRGDYLAVAVQGTGVVKVFGFDDTGLYFISSVAAANVYCAVWSPDGKYLATTDNSATRYIRVYSFNGQEIKPEASYATGIARSTTHLEWTPNGKFLCAGIASSSTTGYVKMYSVSASTITEVGSASVTTGSDNVAVRMSIAPDASVILASGDGVTSLILIPLYSSGAMGTALAPVALGTTVVGDFAWSPCGRYVAIPMSSNQVRIYRVYLPDASPIVFAAATAVDANTIYNVRWSSDGRYVIYGDGVGGGKLYSFLGNSAVLLKSFPLSLNAAVYSLAWSPDGKYIAAGSQSASSTSQIIIMRAMYGPLNCIVDNCSVSGSLAAYSNLGRGIVMGGSRNMATQNVCNNNGVNVSYGVPNVYWGRYGITRSTILPFDSISCPTVL